MPLNKDQPVSFGEHELSNLLGAWGKADSPSNREILSAEAKKFRGEPDWGPHTWERFYQYVDVRHVKKLLSDKAGAAKRFDEEIGSGYTVVEGWGPPQPKQPAPVERKAEPAVKPIPAFTFDAKPAPPKEPSTVFSAPSQPPPAPPKQEPAPPRDEPVTVLREQKPAPPPKEPSPVFPENKPAPPPSKPAPPSFKPAPSPPPGTTGQKSRPEMTRMDTAPGDETTAERQPSDFTRTESTLAQESGAPHETETIVEARIAGEAPQRKRKSLVPVLLAVLGGIAIGVVILILAVTRPSSENSAASPGAITSPKDSASVSPQPSPVTATVAERFIRTVGENTPIMFIGDEEFFLPGEERKLDNILSAAKGIESADLYITGHTADNNMPHAQFVLSLERAQAVRDYLLKNPAGSVFTIKVRGRGALEPVVTGVPLAEQAANRRAEIEVRSAE